MIRTCWIVVFMFLITFQVAAQTARKIIVNAHKTSLSQVLLDLKERYDLQFAFDNDLLSRYSISIDRAFSTEEEALNHLLKNLPLELEKSGDVFIIIPTSLYEERIQEPGLTNISGQILEAQTYEPLPFSYISINNKYVQSDQQGNFNFIASADTTFDLRISHLGYYVYDTLITQSVKNTFLLNPQVERIEEVKVLSDFVEKSTLIGDKAGRIKINHRIAPVLPGHGDNSVFNLLRLMPGVLASGEQSNDLLIWGGYESHSKIQFDGFTLFGLKNFNDNISVVNPFMVKNIEVMKGGYEARYGGRVGGIVDITGKSGTLHKPKITFNINTTTVNSMLEVPLSERSSLMAAYRQTYYQLYDPTTVNLFGRNQPGNQQNSQNIPDGGIDFTVKPDFVFRDANIKYVHRGKKGSNFAWSFYGGGDKFDYDMEGSVLNTNLLRKEEERNKQFGTSVQYYYTWKNGNATKFIASYSAFERDAFEQNRNENSKNGKNKITKEVSSENNVDEITLNAEHPVTFKEGHKLILGGTIINNNVELSRKSFEKQIIDLNTNSPRFITYLQDELLIGKFMELKTGIRSIYASELKKWYLEPRVSTTLRLTDDVKLNASWGLYNQFMAKTSVVDSSYNYSYFWTNSDNENIPVLQAEHWVAGLTFHKSGFTLSGEGFYKTTDGLTRFFNGSKHFEQGFYKGNARTRGLDFFLKKEYKNNMAWISYTLSKTEESFPFYRKDIYKLAPHHQTHEVKFAGILNLGSFYISANYVYGSGFERYDFETENGLNLDQDYKRLDAAIVYRFRPGKIKAEAGLSILNVLDYDNIKYSNLRRTTVDDISLVGIYADAVPFTPALFLNIEL